MAGKLSTDDLSFWFLWVVANAVGMAVGTTIRQFLLPLGAWAATPFFVGALVGLSLGLAQLRSINWKWTLVTTVGWMIGWPAGWSIGWNWLSGPGLTQVFAIIGAVAGLLTGSMQWLILRQRSARAGWWVPASAIGWTVGMAVGIGFGGGFGWPLVGAISGAITGSALLWILG